MDENQYIKTAVLVVPEPFKKTILFTIQRVDGCGAGQAGKRNFEQDLPVEDVT